MSVKEDAGGRRVEFYLALTMAAVAYGSLYPFRAVPPEDVVPRVVELFTTFRLDPSLGDVLGNIALFFPVGVLGAWSAHGPRAGARVCFWGTAFAVLLQLGQVFVRGRVPAIDDAFWNGIGTMTGAVSARAMPRIGGAKLHLGSLPLLLAGSWILYRLLPLVPALDVQQIKDSLKPLLLHPELSAAGVTRSFAGWLTFALVWEGLPHATLRRIPWYAAVPWTMAGEVLVIRNAVTFSNVCGAAAALVAWRWARDRRERYAAGAACLLAAIAVLALEPFELRAERASFHWVPFHGLLNGSLYVNVQQLILKLYLYGSTVWLLLRSGRSLASSAPLLAAWVLGLEILQTWVPGRTAEATDVLLVLFAAAAAALLENPVMERPPSAAPSAAPTPPSSAEPRP